ncbi:MAG: hypothetical protein Q8P05_01315 [Candidatus Diapherotrites archaeon]|nr:hypothetical protein [Candidatus Diapherotrites archaeon]MDZ4256815.1 hypothetical protein [archaeon]
MMMGKWGLKSNRKPDSGVKGFMSKKPFLMVALIFAIGLGVGVTYASHTGTPLVSHEVLQIMWEQFALSFDPKGDGTHFVEAMNAASESLPNQYSGINADTLDGLDSTDFSGQGGGGAGTYSTKCTWVTGYQTAWTQNPAPTPDWYNTKCQDEQGRDKLPPNDVPPPCPTGPAVGLGVQCYITGINALMVIPTNHGGQFGDDGVNDFYVGVNGCSPVAFPYTSSEQCPINYSTSGVCERICLTS